MAEAISESCEQVGDFLIRSQDISRRWNAQVAGLRSDAAARRLVGILPRHLVVTAPMVTGLLNVSGPTARAAINSLATLGLLQPLELRPNRPGRPAQWRVAGEFVSALGRWAR
ncbi:MAG: hypothetical protein ACT4OS_03165 [Acidimicrobiales bacterium]